MRKTTRFGTAALLALGALGAGSVRAQDPGQQTADPLAEAARKARAEQKDAPKPKKVFTNDDFAPPPAVEAKPGQPVLKPGEAAEDKETAAENDPKSEAYWRKRFKKAHEKLAQSERELDVLQRELNKNEVQYYPDPQKALTQQYTRDDINKDRGKLEAKQKEVDDLRKQISDMEDDLRKAGGDPGWAR